MTDPLADTSAASDETVSRFQVLHEFAKEAKARLSPPIWDYIIGGAETEATVKRNRQAIERLAFRPRVLRDVSGVTARADVLGMALRLPVILAPIGSLQQIVDGGGGTIARAAGRFGCAHMLSSVCHPGLARVAEMAPDTQRIFQLYVRGDADWVDDQVRQAVDAGYRAFTLTVDLDAYSRRERDLAKRFKTEGRMAAVGEANQAKFAWSDIARLRKLCTIPMILKGIATKEDAAIAVEHGIDCVYVSNHGGRQLDWGRGALDVLPEVVAEVAGRAEVWVDGGIMRGTDIVKALALGADAVGIGRLQAMAAGAGGEDGVVRMLELLEAEVLTALALLGVTSAKDLGAAHLHPAEAVSGSHVLSAFPLLDEGY